MAKTPKLKKSSKSPSLHSRASKRQPSPIPKSLLATADALPRRHHAKTLAPTTPHAGIAKKKAKSKPLKRGQLRRKAQGVEKAEAFRGKMEGKVERTLGRGKRARERGREWEELNGRIAGGRDGRKKGDGTVGGMEGGREEEVWVDEEDRFGRELVDWGPEEEVGGEEGERRRVEVGRVLDGVGKVGIGEDATDAESGVVENKLDVVELLGKGGDDDAEEEL